MITYLLVSIFILILLNEFLCRASYYVAVIVNSMASEDRSLPGRDPLISIRWIVLSCHLSLLLLWGIVEVFLTGTLSFYTAIFFSALPISAIKLLNSLIPSLKDLMDEKDSRSFDSDVH